MVASNYIFAGLQVKFLVAAPQESKPLSIKMLYTCSPFIKEGTEVFHSLRALKSVSFIDDNKYCSVLIPQRSYN